MESFKGIYSKLNDAQKQAVNTIYGPILVIAGPGTGKTQLLSARVANILEKTDANPNNILCLTFTESGARNMRERLTRFIGPAAYDVTISTYHGLGSSLIGRFPEYFSKLRLENPIDELGKHETLAEIADNLDYDDPLKYISYSLGDLIGAVSEVKRGLITPELLRKTADNNQRLITDTSEPIAEALVDFTARMPSKLDVALPKFQIILDELLKHDLTPTANSPHIPNLAHLASVDLQSAIGEALSIGKTKPLTAWKNKWLTKSKTNQYVLSGKTEAVRMKSLADIVEDYQAALAQKGLYDFDDMILEAIQALSNNDELRFSLQEQYQFVLLDEFQDTNAAQLKLVELLTNNPVHEGRPNVLAVGDDDQAIYAFQGAEVSNMIEFSKMYQNVSVITLTENYRSHQTILDGASNIAAQIEGRLHHNLPNVSKNLTSKATNLAPLALKRLDYKSDIAEREGVAKAIRDLLDKGVKASEIAVLAPKHRFLQPLVPFLQAKDIAVNYEKRENILESRRIHEVITMCRLINAIVSGNQPLASSLWPEVLSYEFWGFPVEDIWQLSWQASDNRQPWSQALLNSPVFRHAGLIMLSVAAKSATETAENILDALIGTTDIQTGDKDLPSVRSPYRDFHFKVSGETGIYETVTELTVLREKFREYTKSNSSKTSLSDLLDYISRFEAAEQQMINTSPIRQADQAVQLMTVFKSKGLEFEHVFIINSSDDVWGSKASGQGSKLTLPENLKQIRYGGSTEDEKLRILFVAMTRAKSGLYLTSHRQNFAGKQPEALKYLDEVKDGDQPVSRSLPSDHRSIQLIDEDAVELETVELNWHDRHTSPNPDLKTLLSDRLASYHISPTHLTKFIDLSYGGPESFLLDVILRFPGAPSVDSTYGNVVHETLQWVQETINRGQDTPSTSDIINYAESLIDRSALSTADKSRQLRRASRNLTRFIEHQKSKFAAGNVPEKNFRSEGVVLDENVLMGGKIDLLEIDKATKTITVVDYKTSKPTDSWKPATLGLHKYQLQLYAYKILVERSKTYRGYTVDKGKIVFTEPDTDGDFFELELYFTDDEVKRVERLLVKVFRLTQMLELPDTSAYGDSLTAVKDFEKHLLEQ